MSVDSVTLSNGVKIPLLGFGTFQLKGEMCEKSVYNAIKIGYRLIDTAAAYENEIDVGRGIEKAINDQIVTREELYISGKIWIDDFGEKKTYEAFNKSLERLQLNYMDICLLHYPYGDTYGAWRGLTKLYKEGKLRAMGVSNFMADHIIDFCAHNELKPVVDQIEMHPYCQHSELQNVLEQLGIKVIAWSPLGGGRLNLQKNKKIIYLSRKYHVTTSKILLRWLYQKSVISIPKASSSEHIFDNYNIDDCVLSDRDMHKILSLNKETSIHFGREMFHNRFVTENVCNIHFDDI